VLKQLTFLSISIFVVAALTARAGAPAAAVPPGAATQAAGNAGTVEATVTDPTGAVVPSAKVKIENRASRFSKEGQTDPNGVVRLSGIPPNPYHVEVSSLAFRLKARTSTFARRSRLP
jgi:hypothetical protein